MKSLYDFIVKPLSDRYENKIKVDNKELILNTKIEDHVFVSKKAVVVSTPAAFKTSINVGDEVYIHHNIFRRWYDAKGRERNSSTYFKDDLYFCSSNQIYLYKKDNKIKCNLNYCFVSPVQDNSILSNSKEKKLLGVVKYCNESLELKKVSVGDLVIFSPDSEFEFIVEKERLYCMKSNNIAVIHEYKGNEKKYNPSWAQSS